MEHDPLNHLRELRKSGKLSQLHLDALYYAFNDEDGHLFGFHKKMVEENLRGHPIESVLNSPGRYAWLIASRAQKIRPTIAVSSSAAPDERIRASVLKAAEDIIPKIMGRLIQLGLVAPITFEKGNVGLHKEGEAHGFLTQYLIPDGKQTLVRTFLKENHYRI